MTEKRFTLEEFGLNFIVNDNGRNLTAKQTVDRLNELNDDKEQLKQDKTNLHRAMSRDRVKYNQFRNKVFWCIDKRIKLLKDCHMTNEARILEDLQKEIVDDGND